MNYVLTAAFAFLIATFPSAAFAGSKIVVVTNPAQVPEGQFIFGVQNINTGEIAMGYAAPGSTLRNGGHYQLIRSMMRTSGGNIGDFAAFGFVKDAGKIYIHPWSSLKGAASAGSGSFGNPRLPAPNPHWAAILPEEYAPDVFNALSDTFELRLEIDDNLTGSTRFPFNAEKHPGGASQKFLNATTYLPRVISEANMRRYPMYKVGTGMVPPDILGIPLEDTIYPEFNWKDFSGRNLSDGMKTAIEQSPVIPDECTPTAERVNNRRTSAKAMALASGGLSAVTATPPVDASDVSGHWAPLVYMGMAVASLNPYGAAASGVALDAQGIYSVITHSPSKGYVPAGGYSTGYLDNLFDLYIGK